MRFDSIRCHLLVKRFFRYSLSAGPKAVLAGGTGARGILSASLIRSFRETDLRTCGKRRRLKTSRELATGCGSLEHILETFKSKQIPK